MTKKVTIEEEIRGDEVDQELMEMAREIEGGDELAERPQDSAWRSEVEKGRALAILSYFSVMFAVPVFVVPLVLRDNHFSLHHGKAAGVIYLLGMLLLAMALWIPALFLPLAFVCYIPAIIGVYRASAGVEAGKAAFGEAGERVFQRIEVQE